MIDMGLIQHNAMIATTLSVEEFSRVRLAIEARDDRDLFTFNQTKINAYHTIIIPPDGSKEGWDDSDAGDSRRQWLIELIQQGPYIGGYWDYVDVSFGELGARIEATNCKDDAE